MNRGWALFKRNNFILTGRARKSSIKEENPQYCEPFRNKVLRFKTSKVNRMNRIIGLWESQHIEIWVLGGGLAYIYIYIYVQLVNVRRGPEWAPIEITHCPVPGAEKPLQRSNFSLCSHDISMTNRG